MRKNWLTTLGGVMVGLGTLPMLVATSHVAFPLWWNDFQFPLVLLGLLGGVVLGIAAKGADQHSTENQVQISTAESVVAQVKAEDDKKPKP